MKKSKSILFAIGISSLLVGCSNQSNAIPKDKQFAQEKVEERTIDFETTEYSTDKLTVQVPTSWRLDNTSDPSNIFVLKDVWKATEEFAPKISLINVPIDVPKDSEKYLENFPEKFTKAFKTVGTEGFVETTIEQLEMIDMSFGQVAYIELKSKTTNEGIDLMIKENELAEALVDAVGGREVLIDASEESELQIHMVKNEEIFIIRGVYDDASYESVKEVALYIAQTLSVK